MNHVLNHVLKYAGPAALAPPLTGPRESQPCPHWRAAEASWEVSLDIALNFLTCDTQQFFHTAFYGTFVTNFPSFIRTLVHLSRGPSYIIRTHLTLLD